MVLSTISTLDWLATTINQWVGLIIFICGILGNLFNLIIFTRRTLLKQSCSLYILATSINNLAMFFTGLLTRILDEGFHISIFGGNSDIYCKIRTYLVYTLFAISSWFLVFVSIDRYYSTNQSALKRQKYCSTSMALKFICLTIIGCLLVHIHIIIYYQYISQLNPFGQFSLTCTTNNSIYNIFFSFFMLIFYSLLPPTLMTIIGLLTLNNIRKSRQHINPSTSQRIIRITRDTHQLRKSLSIQIIILIILTIPHSCYWIYMGLTSNSNALKTPPTRQYEKFTSHIVRLLLYINYASSFYIQIIISKTFREEFIKTIETFKRYCRNFY